VLSKLYKYLRFIRRKIFRIEKHEVFVAEAFNVKHQKWLPEEKASIITGDIEIEDALYQALIYYSPDNREFIEALRRREVDGLFVHVNEKLVHYAFLIRCNKTTRLIGFDKKTALIGNMYTAFDYRGKGCQKRATSALLNFAFNSGVRRVIAETSYTNDASQHGLKNGGMHPFGKVELLVLLNFFVIRYRRPSDQVSLVEAIF